MNAVVNRRPGSATFSGVRFAPTLAPTSTQFARLQLRRRAFKGVKVSFVYRFV